MFQWLCVELLLWTGLLFVSAYSDIHELGTCHYNNIDVKEDNTTVIYLLSLLPYPQPVGKEGGASFQPSWDGGPGVLPAAQLAVQHVNEDPNTLTGFTVKLINAESGCNHTNVAMVSFIKHIIDDRARNKRRPIVGIVGPACSESTITLSSITGRAGLTMPVVHIASSAELEDREKYPYTFGVLGSTFQIIKALFSFIHHNGWKEVAVLYEDTGLYSNGQLRDLIISELSIINDGFIVFDSPINDAFFPFDSLERSKAKIIAVTTSLILARKIMCIASDRGMTFPDYQWLVVGFSHDEFLAGATMFHYNRKLYNCNWTDSMYENTILDHQLFMHFRLSIRNGSFPLVSGRTYQQIAQEYAQYLYYSNYNMNCPFAIAPNIWAPTVYDAVWALVQALNRETTDADSHVYFSNANLSDKIKVNFQNIAFNGTSGLIQFDNETGFVHRFIDVDQIHDGEANLIGSIFRGKVMLSNITFITLPTMSYQYETVNQYLAAVFVLVEIVLFIATVLVHIVTVYKRKYPSIKASSPDLNQFFFFGCYTLCAVAIVYILIMKAIALPNNVVRNGCHAFLVWLVPIAITLTFGTLIAKTWRIYRIFIHFREPGPLISNKALIVIVVIQLSIDIVIGTAWSIQSPITLEILDELTYTNHNGDVIVPRQCVFTNTAYWLIILGLYKSLQILSLFVLSFLTRNVQNKRFSTVSVRVASYLGLLLITILFPLYFFLWSTNADVAADFVVLCVFFSGNGFVFLIVVLVPPVFPLLSQTCKFKFIQP